MGLDMYLTAARTRVGYDFFPEAERALYRELVRLANVGECPESPVACVEVRVAYWRKANAVHAWFVRNVQDGVDNCARYEVSREELDELRQLCSKLLQLQEDADSDRATERAKEFLPPQAGFFFGDTAIDDDYWADVRSTVTQLERVLQRAPIGQVFYYQASW